MNHQRADEAVKPVVLLAAETNFVTDYVASVLCERGISMIGPLVDPSQAVQVLATQPVRAAILFETAASQDRARLIAMLNHRALPYLTVMGPRNVEGQEDGAVLFSPFAAYQVADWVAEQT